MNAKACNPHDDMVWDHVSMLSKHETEIAALKISDASTSIKVSALGNEMLIVKTKITLYATVAVFLGNVGFQIAMKLFF